MKIKRKKQRCACGSGLWPERCCLHPTVEKSSQKPRTPPSPARDLIVIDQLPLRKKVFKRLRTVLSNQEKTHADWARYQEIYSPEYQKWYFKKFGALLTENRELQSQLQEVHSLVREIHIEAQTHSISLPHAYRRVMKYWEDLEKRRKIQTAREEFYSQKARNEYLKNKKRMEEKNAAEDEDGRLFECDDWLKDPFDESTHEQENPDHFSEESFILEPDAQQDPIAARQSKVKLIYRQLAKRLHPDQNPHLSSSLKTLWNEVQSAYQDQSLELLELCMNRLEYDGLKEFQVEQALAVFDKRGWSISQILVSTEYMKYSLKSVSSQLRKIKKTPAWLMFYPKSKVSPHEIEYSEKRTLRNQIRSLHEEITDLHQWLDYIRNPPQQSPRQNSNGQYEFEL